MLAAKFTSDALHKASAIGSPPCRSAPQQTGRAQHQTHRESKLLSPRCGPVQQATALNPAANKRAKECWRPKFLPTRCTKPGLSGHLPVVLHDKQEGPGTRVAGSRQIDFQPKPLLSPRCDPVQQAQALSPAANKTIKRMRAAKNTSGFATPWWLSDRRAFE